MHKAKHASKKADSIEARESSRHGADQSAAFERALQEENQSPERYVFRLYITGNTSRSTKAIQNIRALCEEYLRGRYDLEVIDINQQPVLARGEQIIAAPTLIKRLPMPLRKFVGDLSNSASVLIGLDLRTAAVAAKGM